MRKHSTPLRWHNLFSRRDIFVFLALLLFSFIPAVGGLVRVVELAGGPALMPLNPRAVTAPLPVVVHILASFVFCVLGALQFLSSIRRYWRTAHRALGGAVATAGVIAALSGLWMTHFFSFPTELQGNLLYIARLAVGGLMLGLIGWGVVAIVRRNILAHGAAMLRAYAIGQGASTQAVLGIAWLIAFGAEPDGTSRDVLMVSAWLLNLVVVQILIEWSSPQRISRLPSRLWQVDFGK